METSKNHLIRNFLRNGRLSVKTTFHKKKKIYFSKILLLLTMFQLVHILNTKILKFDVCNFKPLLKYKRKCCTICNRHYINSDSFDFSLNFDQSSLYFISLLFYCLSNRSRKWDLTVYILLVRGVVDEICQSASYALSV